MRVIGVLDLVGGRAVHAQGGRRRDYRPVRNVAGRAIEPGDAVALARIYLEGLGLRELYAADLDAIEGRTPQNTVIASLASLGAPLWVDAGISSADRARGDIDRGAARLVIGLETLTSFDALDEICSAVGGDRIAFSLDLCDGSPHVGSGFGRIAPEAIAARAAAAGVGSLIVLDLARVGTASGVDIGLISRVRDAAPEVTLVAGGGVRDEADLERLADAGCDGALVATAILEGRLNRTSIGMSPTGRNSPPLPSQSS